jgi:hypothetical protein
MNGAAQIGAANSLEPIRTVNAVSTFGCMSHCPVVSVAVGQGSELPVTLAACR